MTSCATWSISGRMRCSGSRPADLSKMARLTTAQDRRFRRMPAPVATRGRMTARARDGRPTAGRPRLARRRRASTIRRSSRRMPGRARREGPGRASAGTSAIRYREAAASSRACSWRACSWRGVRSYPVCASNAAASSFSRSSSRRSSASLRPAARLHAGRSHAFHARSRDGARGRRRDWRRCSPPHARSPGRPASYCRAARRRYCRRVPPPRPRSRAAGDDEAFPAEHRRDRAAAPRPARPLPPVRRAAWRPLSALLRRGFAQRIRGGRAFGRASVAGSRHRTTSAIAASSSCAVTGLTTRRSIPASRQRSSASGVASAVTPMIGRCGWPSSMTR